MSGPPVTPGYRTQRVMEKDTNIPPLHLIFEVHPNKRSSTSGARKEMLFIPSQDDPRENPESSWEQPDSVTFGHQDFLERSSLSTWP